MNDVVDAGMIARSQAMADRKARARTAAPVSRVRVLPRDETIRKYIKHWPSGIAFPADGSVEWPNDRFTQRRIRDGDVTVEGAEAKSNPHGNTRARAPAAQSEPPKT